MWQRFTSDARVAFFRAQEAAQKHGDAYVRTEHLLLGLLVDPSNLACCAIEDSGVSLNRVRAEVERQCYVSRDPRSKDMTLAPRAKRVVDLSWDEARKLSADYIGTEHLLLGLVREGDGLGGRVLTKLGIELGSVRQIVSKLKREEQTPAPSSDLPPALTLGETLASHRDRLLPEAFQTFITGHCLPQHILLNLIAADSELVGRVIRAQCDDVGALQWELWMQIRNSSKRGILPPNPSTMIDLLASAATEAGGEVKPHHILLALLTDVRTAYGRACKDAGISLEVSRKLISKELGQ